MNLKFLSRIEVKSIELALAENMEPESVTDAINLVKQDHVLKALNEVNRAASLQIEIPGIHKEASDLILRKARDFQEDLRLRAQDLARGTELNIQHVHQALEKRDERIKELALAFGSGFIGVFLGELIQTVPRGELPSSLHGIALAIGMLMVLWKRAGDK